MALLESEDPALLLFNPQKKKWRERPYQNALNIRIAEIILAHKKAGEDIPPEKIKTFLPGVEEKALLKNEVFNVTAKDAGRSLTEISIPCFTCPKAFTLNTCTTQEHIIDCDILASYFDEMERKQKT